MLPLKVPVASGTRLDDPAGQRAVASGSFGTKRYRALVPTVADSGRWWHAHAARLVETAHPNRGDVTQSFRYDSFVMLSHTCRHIYVAHDSTGVIEYFGALGRLPPKRMTRLFLAIPLFAGSAFDAVHGQVEYQHFDGFSVLTEPSPLPKEKSNESVRMEQILILRDTTPKEAGADKQNCLFLDTNTSVTWETPDSMPVMYVYRNCGRTVEMIYRDLSGREWKQAQLQPLQRETFSTALAQLNAGDGPESDEDAQTQIAAYAICKGVVPKPDWFAGICAQQTSAAPH